MKRITVLDVAKRAGVSQGTVLCVLTGKNWVSEDSRLKVEAAAKALGYVPNALAQGLKAQRTNTVAARTCQTPCTASSCRRPRRFCEAPAICCWWPARRGQVDQELALLSLFAPAAPTAC